MVVHHIDCNPFNNNPDNLCVMSRKEHYKIHPRFTSRKARGKHISLNQRMKELEEALILYNFNL